MARIRLWYSPAMNLTRFVAVGLVAAAIGFLVGRVVPTRRGSTADGSLGATGAGGGQAGGSVFAPAAGAAGRPGTGDGGKGSPASASAPGARLPRDLEGLIALNDPADWFGTATRLGNAVAALSDSELEAIVTQAASLSDHSPNKHQVLNAAISEWARRDPQAALAFGQKVEDRNARHQLVTLALGQLAGRNPGAALREMDAIDDRDLRAQAMNSIVQGMMASDPQGAVALAADWAKKRPEESWPLEMAFRNWAMTDVKGALERAEALESGRMRDGALAAVAAVWAGNDPKGAVDWASALPPSGRRDNILGQVVGAWASTDPQAAGDWLLTQKDINIRNNGVGAVVQNLFNRDKDAALAWIAKLGDVGETGMQRQAYQNLSWSLGRTDPDLAIAMSKAFPPGQMAEAFARGAVDGAPIEKLPDLLRQLDDLPEGRTKGNLVARAIQRIGERDPAQAAKMAAVLPDGQEYSWAFSNLASQWAIENPDAALAWAAGIEDPERRKLAQQGALGQLTGQDPIAAAKIAAAMQGDVDPSVFSNVAANWAQRDPDAAMDWAAKLSGDARREALTGAIGGYADADPIKAAEMFSRYESVLHALDTGSPDSGGANALANTASRLASTWAQWDPEAAAQWGLSLSGDSERSAVIENTVGTWSDVDPLGASSWIAELPDGALRDKAAERLIHSIHDADPASAFEWATSLGSDDARFRMAAMVARDWVARAPEQAVQQVMNSPFSPDERDRLLSEIQPILEQKAGR